MADEITQKEEVVVETQNEPISELETVISPETPTAQIPVNEPLPAPTEAPIEQEAEPITETTQTETKPAETEIQPELVSETIPESFPQTIPESVSEPIQTESKPVEQAPEVKVEPKVEEVKPESKQETKSEPEQPKITPVIIPSKNLARELLVKARSMIQFRKRKKLDKIMTLFLKKQKITNDEIEKFMHVSDATATRYLSQLEKEGKIKQSGKTGKSVFYTKI